MKKEAEEHASEDQKKKDLIESRNLADQMIYTAEKALNDHKDSITAEIRAGVEGKIKELKEVKDTDDNEAIKEKIQTLSAEMSKIGETMQKKAQAQNPNQDAGKQEDGNIRDAETGDNHKKQE
jgi:molecular chaperone DnaK